MVTQIITTSITNQAANNNSFLPISGGILDNGGNIIVFSSNAFNLVPGDDNAVQDIFLSNQGTLANLTLFRSNGTKTNAPSTNPSLSQNGQRVVFQSQDKNLSNVLAGGIAGINHIYLATDLNNSPPTFSLITNVYDQDSRNPSISADGRWIVYETLDDINTDLAAGFDGDGTDYDIILYDTVTGSTTWVSQISDGDGLVTNGNTGFNHLNPSVSGDGRYVVFETAASASTMIPNPPNALHTDVNGLSDIFLFDRNNNSLRLVSHANTSPTIAASGASTNPVISADGNYIVYQSFAENLVVGDSNFQRDIFVYNVNTGENTKVNLRPGNAQTNSDSRNPSINSNGNYIAFESDDPLLVSDDNNSTTDVFVWERPSNTISLYSADSNGNEGNNSSFNPAISPDGQKVAFQSSATNLDSPVQGGFTNVFLADQTTVGIPQLFINDVTVNEGSGNATLTVTLSNPSTQIVTVNYATADGSAISGSDYQANNGTLTFNPNETTKQIQVSLINDNQQESNETFRVNLSNPSNATIADGEGIVTISDNDSPPSSTEVLDTPFYRLRNDQLAGQGVYLFAGEQEKNSALRDYGDTFTLEGGGSPAFYVADQPGDGLIAIHRLAHKQVGGAYLFAGDSEKDSALTLFPDTFQYEGVAFYAYPSTANIASDYYRLGNKNINGTYLFAGESEKDDALRLFPNTFQLDGPAFEVGTQAPVT